MSSTKRTLRYRHYWHPRWWPTWLTLGAIWLIAQLPLRLQQTLGRLVGGLAYHLLARRRHIAETNIRLCFPELDAKQQAALVKESFRSNGIGLFESATGWFRNPERLRRYTRVHGLEHIEKALQHGKGILLLGGHYSTLDLSGSLVTLFIEADVTQRDHDNPLFNAVMTRSRESRYGIALGRKDLRGLLRRLKANRIVWYAPDQDYGTRNSVFAPFFGVPAATITATARIAGSSGCKVVPFSHFRHDDGIGYDIYFHPPLEDFPSGDDIADATRVNQALESEIRKHPAQYLWMHRRFKSKPDESMPDRYARPPQKGA